MSTLLDVHCYCGNHFHVPEAVEGGRQRCTRCGQEVEVPRQVRFQCVKCDRRLRVGIESVGKKGRCISCGNVAIVPEPEDPGALCNCPFCGERVRKNARKCRHCREYLADVSDLKPAVSPRLLERLRGWVGRPAPQTGAYRTIPVEAIEANPYQPREHVEREALDKLKASVQEYGIIVPIIVREIDGRRYQLVAGQRRLAACRQLGIARVPAIVRTLGVKEMIELSYLENLHRCDLSAVERAQAFARLKEECPELPGDVLSAMIGRDPHEVTRERELLDLPVLLREAIVCGMLNEEQARILSEIPDPQRLLHAVQHVYTNRLSDEETRQYAERSRHPKPRYCAAREGSSFHNDECVVGKAIPEGEAVWMWSAAEAMEAGMTACVLCGRG